MFSRRNGGGVEPTETKAPYRSGDYKRRLEQGLRHCKGWKADRHPTMEARAYREVGLMFDLEETIEEYRSVVCWSDSAKAHKRCGDWNCECDCHQEEDYGD